MPRTRQMTPTPPISTMQLLLRHALTAPLSDVLALQAMLAEVIEARTVLTVAVPATLPAGGIDITAPALAPAYITQGTEAPTPVVTRTRRRRPGLAADVVVHAPAVVAVSELPAQGVVEDQE